MSWSNPLSSLAVLVRDRIEQWQEHGRPNAALVLAEHPELREARSLVMDLVLAEYSLRKESEGAVEKSEYYDRYPEYRQSLQYLLEVQDYLDRCPALAVVDDAARWPIPGESFLGYEIVEPLGRGGLARVFLAREMAVGNRHVVIKVSPLGEQEAQTLGKLSHPGIVPIHSVTHDREGDWTLICMPLLGAATGIDLLDAAFNGPEAIRSAALVARVAQETKPLAEVPLPKPEKSLFPRHFSYSDAIGQLGLNLAEALGAAHAAGVLHRDIKPSNMLLAWSGRAMLLDFNLSTRAELEPQRVGGTLAYMAPEIIESLLCDQGQAAKRFDPRCDVYSLGVVLYELLAGRLPHKPEAAERLAATDFAPWLASKRQAPTALCGIVAGVDPALAAIVHKCLAFAPEERYADAASLAAELRAYLSPLARAQRLAKRKRRELVAVLVALAACLGWIFYYIATKPSELDSLYQQALAHYDAGEFKQAEKTFGLCLQLRKNWPQALFGRAQSLRRQNQWKAARTDFVALAEGEPAWAYALAGYSGMQANDLRSALFDFQQAYAAGLRDFDFLLNYAAVQRRRGRHFEAAEICSDILKIDALHRTALKERALAHLALVNNDRNKIPSDQAFADVRLYHEIEESFDGPFLAARIYGEAGRKDNTYEAAALEYLQEAIERGLPKGALDKLPPEAQWLFNKLDRDLVANAKEGSLPARSVKGAVRHPSETAIWGAFLNAAEGNNRSLAGS